MQRTVSTFAVLFVLFLMLVGQVVDYVDQVQADRHYCSAVRMGSMPDYASKYLKEC